MPYIFINVRELHDTEKVGNFQCVDLIKHYTNAGATAGWSKGADVAGNQYVQAGTAIATFVNGHYPNSAHGNHAAFFVSQNPNGMFIIDQWAHSSKQKVSQRFIYRLGTDKNGMLRDPSNNADAFSVIE